MHGAAAGDLEGLSQRALLDARIAHHRAQAGSEHRTQLGIGAELGDHVGARQALPCDREHFVEQLGRRDARRAQTDEALDHQGERHHRANQQRPDRPTGGLYDRKQRLSL